MKLFFLFYFSLFALFANSQTLDNYLRALTSNSTQSWKLDSIKIHNVNDGKFKIGTTLKFKDDSKLVVVYNIEQKTDSLYWSLELRQSQSKYTVIHLGAFGNYEIDFIQNNNELFMRLRDEIAALKNIEVTEFFFIKSNI